MLVAEPCAVYPVAMISGAQIRAARGLLGWSRADLAKRSGVSEISIKRFETAASDPRRGTLERLQRALEAGGVLFLDGGDIRSGGAGVRFRDD